MRNSLTLKKDYFAGALMVLIGVGAVLEARHYSIGTLFHMGPGFFPIILGTYGGLIPATFACVFVSALGDKDITLKSALVLGVAVTVFGVALFSYLLQVSMPMWRWGPL